MEVKMTNWKERFDQAMTCASIYKTSAEGGDVDEDRMTFAYKVFADLFHGPWTEIHNERVATEEDSGPDIIVCTEADLEKLTDNG